MSGFTPLSATLGGVLIGLSASLLLWTNGRIAGISGIVAGAVVPSAVDKAWRGLFLLGLLTGTAGWFLLVDNGFGVRSADPWLLWPAGFLVGVGTRMGSGCTSGHGVCGIARLSPRSLIATLIFFSFGLLTVFVIRHLLQFPATA
ncbi:MAG: YeeE/YedE family protein [Gammaproteobacteria bacterium]|nr:YeeE/YedE family protein [Gammaproteobacteria bacterium]